MKKRKPRREGKKTLDIISSLDSLKLTLTLTHSFDIGKLGSKQVS